MVLKTTIN